ncbi:MAG TPA: hypothetical protein VMG41_09825 [Gemmatimonadales bacterium]|nr:hypothetical protein [Gemmatimonadales bacterium]
MTINGSAPLGAVHAGPASRAYGLAPKTAHAAGAPKAPDTEALRAVLTDDERAYFDQLAALGPLSYGPGRSSGTPAAPRGLRLDVTG